MSTYFATLEQAKKHITKKNRRPSKITWRIVDCKIGFLVLSEVHAQRYFPDLFQAPIGNNMRNEKNYE